VNLRVSKYRARSLTNARDQSPTGGRVDPQWNSPPISITQCTDQTYDALSSGLQIDPPAQIVSVEIGNNPSPADV
jgi:hypothetical protein